MVESTTHFYHLQLISTSSIHCTYNPIMLPFYHSSCPFFQIYYLIQQKFSSPRGWNSSKWFRICFTLLLNDLAPVGGCVVLQKRVARLLLQTHSARILGVSWAFLSPTFAPSGVEGGEKVLQRLLLFRQRHGGCGGADAKYSHLKKLDKASENLKLFKADLLNYDSLLSAIEGCDGVFHVASPVPSGSVPNPEVEVIEPAVKGTLNVLKASLESKVKRVVFVSSVAAVSVNPTWAEGQVLDESCWSDKDYCRNTENWYCLSKTEAESEALQFAKTTGIDLVTVCPTLILGPILQSTVNASTLILIKFLKEGKVSLENRPRKIVDVRDLAEALLMVYEKPEAEGRYICMSHDVKNRDLVENLRRIYPNYILRTLLK